MSMCLYVYVSMCVCVYVSMCVWCVGVHFEGALSQWIKGQLSKKTHVAGPASVDTYP